MTPKNPNTTKSRTSSKRPDLASILDRAYRVMPPKPWTQAGQIWLVDYECRTTAILIAANNNGFFAFGQDAVWGFSNVQAWHRCLHDPPTIF